MFVVSYYVIALSICVFNLDIWKVRITVFEMMWPSVRVYNASANTVTLVYNCKQCRQATAVVHSIICQCRYVWVFLIGWDFENNENMIRKIRLSRAPGNGNRQDNSLTQYSIYCWWVFVQLGGTWVTVTTVLW